MDNIEITKNYATAGFKVKAPHLLAHSTFLTFLPQHLDSRKQN